MRWLAKTDSPMSSFSPNELVVFQGEHRDFQVLDVVQKYILSFEGTAHYKRFIYAALRSFFMHNRVSLPQDRGFNVRAEKPKNVGTLTVDEVRRVLDSCNECYRALFLCMFQSGMGIGELEYWSDHGCESLLRQFELDKNPIRVDLPGRKQGRNTRPFYTFIGRDAIDALRVWLRKRPKEAKAIFTNQFGGSITRYGIRYYWTRHLHRLGLIKKPDPWIPGHRYGKNPHEFRDLFRSRWQKSGRVPEAAEFFMGHVIDPNEYNKAFMDENYARREYRRAEKWLNILSEDPEHVHIDEVDGMVNDLLKAKGFLLEEALKRIELLEKK